MAVETEGEEESCEGPGQEECLMRRTLADRTDYIYTQSNNPWFISIYTCSIDALFIYISSLVVDRYYFPLLYIAVAVRN